LIGKTLAHYEITGLLGKGGMGEVYRARDTRLKRDVALKIVPTEMAADPARLERFQREAETVAGLNHPNIVHLYSVEHADELHFLTMELVDGLDLRELLGARELELPEVLEIGIAVADALSSAHTKGVVHRDLKPSNLMRGSDGRMKILDFGLAKMIDPGGSEQSATRGMPLTGSDAIVGTIPYMSPEQLGEMPVDGRGDLFSLGIVLYELLTGRRPFAGNSSSEISAAILRDVPPMPTVLKPELPARLDQILSRCLAKEPSARYASAADLRDALTDLRAETVSGSTTAQGTETPTRARLPLMAIVLLAAAAALAATMYFLRGDDTPQEIRSLAVLPFVNRSGDPTQEYFSDGFTDQLTTTLSDVSALKVIARASAASYKGSMKRAAEIGGELGVDGLITGTVLRSENRIRITAELVSTSDETNVWARSYERSESDVLKLQAEVARAIADAIAIELSPADSDRIGSPEEVDPRAYDAYLRGRALWSQRTNAAMQQGLELFQTAIDIEPNFALAHAGLADSYIVMSVHGFMDPHEVIPKAKAAVRRAIELDPTAGEPHASLGDMYFHYDWDWEASEASLRRAIELSPGFATAHQWLAEPLAVTGRVDEALQALRTARQLDPLSMIIRTITSNCYEFAGDGERSIEVLREAKQLDPHFAITRAELARELTVRGQLEEALAEAQELVAMHPDYIHGQGVLGLCLAKIGREGEARDLLERLEANRAEPFLHSLQLAKITAGLGDREATLRYLRDGVGAREGTAPFLPIYGEFSFLRDGPEFQSLLDEMGVVGPKSPDEQEPD
jgi:serine/threonine protein kinase/predicted Zn-dependent protease